MAIQRLNLQEIIEQTIEVDETSGIKLLTINDFNTFYKRGYETYILGDDNTNEKYNYLELKAFNLVDRNAGYVLTKLGQEQLLEVYQETEEDTDPESPTFGEQIPVGEIQYGPLYFLKKAIGAQINHWLKNNIFEELTRSRQISDSFTSYAEGSEGNLSPFDMLCNEATMYINQSGVNTVIAMSGISEMTEEDETIAINSSGFKGRWKDTNTTGQHTSDINLYNDLLNPILELQKQFPSDAFAQTTTMVEDVSLVGGGRILTNTLDERDNQINALTNSLSKIETSDTDGIYNVNFPVSDVVVVTNVLTVVPMTTQSSNSGAFEISDGHIQLNETMEELQIQADLDFTVISVPAPNNTDVYEVWVGVREFTDETHTTLTDTAYTQVGQTYVTNNYPIAGNISLFVSWDIDMDVVLTANGALQKSDLDRFDVGIYVRTDALSGTTVDAGTATDPDTGEQTGWITAVSTHGTGVLDSALLSFTNLIDTPSSLNPGAGKTLKISDDGLLVEFGNNFYDIGTPEDDQFKIVSTDGGGQIDAALIPFPVTKQTFFVGDPIDYPNGDGETFIDLNTAIKFDEAYLFEKVAGEDVVTEHRILGGDGDYSIAGNWALIAEDVPVDSVNGKIGVVQLDAVDIPYNDTTGRINATETQTAITNLLTGVVDILKFDDMTDTPLNKVGSATKKVVVNVAENALEYAFDARTEEATIVDERVVDGLLEVKVRVDRLHGPVEAPIIEDGFLPWADPLNLGMTNQAGEIIHSRFTKLQDTPGDYIGHTGKIVKVNVGETGLEFAEEIDAYSKAEVYNKTEIDNLSALAGTGLQVKLLDNVTSVASGSTSSIDISSELGLYGEDNLIIDIWCSITAVTQDRISVSASGTPGELKNRVELAGQAVQDGFSSMRIEVNASGSIYTINNTTGYTGQWGYIIYRIL